MLIHAAYDDDIHPPRTGGTQRSFGLARGLARGHRVRALCVVPNRNRAPARETAAGVELVRCRTWQTSVAWRLERLGIAPLFSAERAHRSRGAAYRAALGGGCDVLATDLAMSGLLADPDVPLRVHSSQNVEYDRFVQAAPRLLLRRTWADALRALEREALERADLTVVCSDEDAARMRELYRAPAERLAVVPNGWDETELRPPTPAERARARASLGLGDGDWCAAFVGADWGPNREALAFLVDHVMPRVAGEGIRLLVVGAVSKAVAGRSEPWLRVAGVAPGMLPLLHAADAGLNPVVRGGGSNVKVPGYLAAGLAVVTTAFGLRGYAPLAAHCVVADRSDFAEALRARPAGTAARGEPAPAALADYAWGRLGERLGELFVSRLGRASGRREA
jgi:hypothetical protein